MPLLCALQYSRYSSKPGSVDWQPVDLYSKGRQGRGYQCNGGRCDNSRGYYSNGYNIRPQYVQRYGQAGGAA